MKCESQGGSVFSLRGGWFTALALLTWACAQGANGDAGPSGSNGGTTSSSGSAGATSAGGNGGTTSAGGSGASTSFGGTNGAGGSASGGTAGSAGSAGAAGSGGTSGSAGSGGASGSAGSGGASGSAGSAGDGGAAGNGGNGGTSGGGSGGTGGTDEPSFGGAGSLEDCDAENAVKTLSESETFTGPADSCIGLSVNYATTKLFLQALPATTAAYPIPFDYASCIGTGSGEFTAVYTNTHLYGTSGTETIPKPDCVIYLKFNGESSDTVSVIHYG